MAESDNKNLSLKQIFSNLKTSVLGTETSRIDNFIDRTFNKIDLYSDKINRNTYITAIKDLTTAGKKDLEPTDVLKELQESPMDIRTIDTSDRINRYREYDAIINKISHCKRALSVLTTNIVSPDNITKHSIEILTVGDDVSEDKRNEKIVNELNTIKNDLVIDDYSNTWVWNTMLRGDYFVEILHSPKGEFAHVILTEEEKVALRSDSITVELGDNKIVLESSDMKNVMSEDEFKKIVGEDKFELKLPKTIIIDGFEKKIGSKQIVTESSSDTIKTVPINQGVNDVPGEPTDRDTVDPEQFQTNKYDQKEKDKKKEEGSVELKDIFITNHKPEYVIRLESERFRSCLGYLVFPKIDLTPVNMFSYLQNKLKQSPIFSVYSTSVQNPVDTICKRILEEIQKRLQTSDSKIYKSKDLKDAVLNYLSFISTDDDLKLRFVPPHMMVHMRIDVNKYEPYGESIFDSVQFDAKLLIALKAANAIKQISSCSDKRIISVESGLARNAKHIIGKVKETMRKRKISVDSLGSIDSIPSQITTFEDIYLPMLDGKEFVRFNSQQWGMQPQNDTENLKFIRDNLVANLMVPPQHIGIEEGNISRASLTQESIFFARTVVGYQKQFSVFLKELFEKIYLLLHPKDLDALANIQISFPCPKTAEYEHEMEYVEQMNRLMDVYKQLEIPIDYLKKKYLPNVDWDKIEKLMKEQKIDNLLEPGSDQNASPFGGGMGGMSSAGLGGIGGGGAMPGGF